MEKRLRLEWKRDPEGYRVEERPGGTFLVPRSFRLENYSHNFDKTKLIFLELTNAFTIADPQLYLSALVHLAKRYGLPDFHHAANVNDFDHLVPQPFALLPFQRVASDAVLRWIPPLTLRGFWVHELVHAIELRVPIGECHYCGRNFVRRLRRGDRKDNSKAARERGTQTPEAHEFCPVTNGVRGKCRHDFHNKGLNNAQGRTGKRVTLPSLNP
jgi:hypothetical protein